MDIPAEEFLLLSFMLNYDIVGQNPISDINSLLDLSKNNLFKLNKPNTSSKKEQNILHNGLPLPDPELGRPKLNCRQCYFENCVANF